MQRPDAALPGRILVERRRKASDQLNASRLDSARPRALVTGQFQAHIGGLVGSIRSKTESKETIDRRIARRLAGRMLVMVGMMGAGKSSVGRRLASRLRMKFVDADTEIELAANTTIPEIFDEHGEEYFRDGERRVIQRLLEGGPKVIATGGGAFIQPKTRKTIESRAISIWLKADRDLLLARVRRRSNRPLLKTGDPGTIIGRLVAERDPIYAKATIHIQSRDVAHEVVIEDILTALDDHLERESRGGDEAGA